MLNPFRIPAGGAEKPAGCTEAMTQRNPTMLLRHFIVLFLALTSLSACQTLPAPAPIVLKQAEVNGVKLSYTEQGTGVPVVFVHGSMSDRRIW